MLIDKNHFFKRFKKPVEENFVKKDNLANIRIDYIDSLNLPFIFIREHCQLKIDDSFMFVLIDNADVTIQGDFKTLVIEDISTIENKINIINKNNSKIIFINNPQTNMSVQKKIYVNNFSELNFFLTAKKNKSFIKNDIVFNLFEKSDLNAEMFFDIQRQQTFDLTAEIVHKYSKTQSNIKFTGLNEGNLVSQINSVVEKGMLDCELHQYIKHILFNKEAISYSKPSLMIDTPCVASHGNSMGTIPEDWLFYLQSKGISLPVCYEIIKKSLQNKFFDNIDLSFINPLLENVDEP